MKNYINRHLRVFREAIASIDEQMATPLKPGVNVTTGNVGTPAQQTAIDAAAKRLEATNTVLAKKTLDELRVAQRAAELKLKGGPNVVIASPTTSSNKPTVTPVSTKATNLAARPGTAGYVPPIIKR
jgi:hypothetical protein